MWARVIVPGTDPLLPFATARGRVARRELVQLVHEHVQKAPGISSCRQLGHGSPATRNNLEHLTPLLLQLEHEHVGLGPAALAEKVDGGPKQPERCRAVVHPGHSQ